MSSGVKLDQCIKDKFEEFKMRKKHRIVSIIIAKDKESNKECFQIEKEILKKDVNDLDDLGALVDLCKDKKSRFIFFAFDVPGVEGAQTEKLFLIQYIPEEASVKEKMLYTTSASCIKDICSTSAKALQLNDFDELCRDLFVNK